MSKGAEHEQAFTYGWISSYYKDFQETTQTFQKAEWPMANVKYRHIQLFGPDENGIFCGYTHMIAAEWAFCMLKSQVVWDQLVLRDSFVHWLMLP